MPPPVAAAPPNGLAAAVPKPAVAPNAPVVGFAANGLAAPAVAPNTPVAGAVALNAPVAPNAPAAGFAPNAPAVPRNAPAAGAPPPALPAALLPPRGSACALDGALRCGGTLGGAGAGTFAWQCQLRFVVSLGRRFDGGSSSSDGFRAVGSTRPGVTPTPPGSAAALAGAVWRDGGGGRLARVGHRMK